MKSTSARTLRRINRAIVFWYDTETDDIHYATAHPVPSEALRAKYAKLKSKLARPQTT